MTDGVRRGEWQGGAAGAIRSRLLAFAAMLLLPAIAISGLLIYRTYTTQRATAEAGLLAAARGFATAVDQSFGQAFVLLRTLGAEDELRAGDIPGFAAVARAADPIGGYFVVFDRTGREWLNTSLPPGAAPPRLTPDADWDHEPANLPRIGAPEPAGPGGEWRLLVGLPVWLGGVHRYTLALALPVSAIQSLMDHEAWPRGWYAVVIDPLARLMARNVDGRRYLGHRDAQTMYAVHAPGLFAIRDGVALDGRRMVAAVVHAPISGWTVAVSAPRAVIAHAAGKSLALLIGLGSALVAAVMVWAGVLSRRIAAPIEALRRNAWRIGEAATLPPVPAGLREADEIGAAMAAANAALAQRDRALRELNADLTERVAARTAELAHANRALEAERSRLGLVLDHIPYGVIVVQPGLGVVSANPEALRVLGQPDTASLAARSDALHVYRGGQPLPPEARPAYLAARGVPTAPAAFAIERPDGRLAQVELSAGLVGGEGASDLVVIALQDISARLDAEEARRRSQRLEAVGQLTGGIAHEFNNLLMAVAGCLELLVPHVATPRAAGLLDTASRATGRGARLTRQLLAFARRQDLRPSPVDLNQAVSGMTDLLAGTLGRAIDIVTSLDPECWPAMADPAQLELVMLNLAINARDAMPGGGQLRIATGNATLGPPTRPEDPQAGQYAALRVIDSGSGMPPEVLARVFEPFFTTKPVGRGSGLGLPQVLGVAQELGGGLAIASAPGEGTRVTLFLPRARVAPPPAPHDTPPARIADRQALRGVAVLVVDDDAEVREVARAMLEEMGARVVEAADAAACLLRLRTGPPVDIALLDLAMPTMTGADLAAEIAGFLPGLRLVLMTGYSAPTLGAARARFAAMLHKPFRAETLAATMLAVLARPDVAVAPPSQEEKEGKGCCPLTPAKAEPLQSHT